MTNVQFLRKIAHINLWIALLFLICMCPACAVEQPAENESTKTSSDDPYKARREKMVRNDIASNLQGRTAVKDKKVLDAMRTVPRHEFVPPKMKEMAYADRPLPIGNNQTISQPYIVAAMTEALKLDGNDVVLEIGTGSGYQAAVLAEIVKEVYTIEIIEELGKSAAEILKTLGYEKVKVKIGDGYLGWPEHAPFDAIIVTAAPNEIPPPLIEQLKPGGRMVIPTGSQWEIQHLMLLEKKKDGSIEKRSIMPVRFVPFTRKKPEDPKD